MARSKTRSRLVKGGGLAGAVTGIGLLAIAFIGSWEGTVLHSYRDLVGVWTGCQGITRGMGPGQTFTQKECDTKFLQALLVHEQGMLRCLKDPDWIPDPSYVAFLSLTYNIGVGAFCRSTARKMLDAHDLLGACTSATWYKKAGGRTVQGLVNRRKLGDATRKSEYELCLEGLAG